MGHAEFLELLLQDELNVSKDRQLERRKLAAGFRALQPLDRFDWSLNPSIDRKTIFELATCRFVRERTDALFLGPPGVGRTCLAQALAYSAIQQGFEVLHRSIFHLIRDFLQAEAFIQQDKTLRKYLKSESIALKESTEHENAASPWLVLKCPVTTRMGKVEKLRELLAEVRPLVITPIQPSQRSPETQHGNRNGNEAGGRKAKAPSPPGDEATRSYRHRNYLRHEVEVAAAPPVVPWVVDAVCRRAGSIHLYDQ